ncbi:MAG: spermidine synthase [Actinomycetes bacterium]
MAEERSRRDNAPRVELVRDHDRKDSYLLSVDGVAQSYVDLADPTHLELEYLLLIADVIDSCFDVGAPIDAVHLGAGACTLPRYVAATRPGSRQHAYDLDEEVVEVVRDRLRIDDVPQLFLIVDEARHALKQSPARSADIVVIDAYDGPRAAVSLLTREAISAAKRVLRRSGVLIANVADRAPFDFVRPVLATLRNVFEHVALLADPGSMRGRRYWNQVIVASQQSLPLDDLRRRVASATPPARLVAGDRLTEFIGDAAPTTDTTPAVAPVMRSWVYDRS